MGMAVSVLFCGADPLDATSPAAERRMIMPKKQNKPIKTCADCIHEFACRGWTGGRRISDTSASQCPNHETVKESGAYLCGMLDERKRKITNADRIRAMSDEELAMYINTGWECSLCKEQIWINNKFSLGDCDMNCVGHCLEWLQQPCEGGE